MVEYEERTQAWVSYFFDKGIEEGLYLEDVPYGSLREEHRRQMWNEAQKQARTGLIPIRRYRCEGNSSKVLGWEWVMQERK